MEEAITLYPLFGATVGQTGAPLDGLTLEELELKAYYQMIKDYQPDPEMQALIQESLGLS